MGFLEITCLFIYFLFIYIVLWISGIIVPQIPCEFNLPISAGFILLSLVIILILFLNFIFIRKLLFKQLVNKYDIIFAFLLSLIFTGAIVVNDYYERKNSNKSSLCECPFEFRTTCRSIISIQ